MRMLAALAILSTTLGSAAQPLETIEVVGSNSFVGIWEISVPTKQTARIQSPRDIFCRIEKEKSDFYTRCFYFILGDVRVKDKHIHISWGPSLGGWSIDADLQSNSYFSGTVSTSVLAFGGEKIPGTVTGKKLSLPEDVADSAGKALQIRIALEQIEQGRLDLPYDIKAIDQHGGQFNSDLPLIATKELRLLGSVQSVRYLGREPDRGDTTSNFFSVYNVEFENGHRLCGIHQRDDGTIDGFRCV